MEHTSDIFEKIAHLSRLMRRRPVGHKHIPHSSHKILRIILENEGIGAGALAEKADIRPSSMTEALARLEQEGYITRERDEVDSRAVRIFATGNARAQHQDWENAHRQRSERACACLTEEELRIFLAVCDKLGAFLEQEEGVEEPCSHKGHPHEGGFENRHD